MSAAGHDLQRLERHAAGELRGRDLQELLQHLDGCEECRSWLETYRILEQALAGESPAAGHPSSEHLARYCAEPDSLTELERRRIAAHLGDCRECERDESLTRAAVLGARPGSRVLAFTGRPPSRWRPVVQKLAAAAVLIAAILGYTLSRSDRPEAVARTLAGNSLSGTWVVDAAESITATSTIVESGGDVTFRAGDAVVLGDGFSISENASFRVEIVKTAAPPADESTGNSPQSGVNTEREPIDLES